MPCLLRLKLSAHDTPFYIEVKCSRHAGSVAAHRLRQRSRRPARHVVCPLAVFSDSISADRQTNQVRPNRRGRFFRAKAQKKIAPDGSAKACLLTAGMPIPTDGLAKAYFLTAGMPTHQDGLASTSLKSKKRPAKSTQSNCIWSAYKPDGSSF